MEPGQGIEVAGRVLQSGEGFGRYTVERAIATGGMAHVILVRDGADHRWALKVLKAGRAQTGLPRFRREFRALSAIDHPNVIRVKGWEEIEGHPCIQMEFVEGPDLHQAFRAVRALRPAERWRRIEAILTDLMQALAVVHQKGLVHRDLKPSNILVAEDGRCKLTDFGIVKDLDPAADPFVSTTLVGTWAYAAPEQMAGTPVDHRADLYSAGVILYAMLTGRRPFVGNDLASYLEAHRSQTPPSPRAIDPEIPEALEALCLRLLAKAPRDRFGSAAEVLAALQPAPAPSAAAPPSRDMPLVGRSVALDELRDIVSALTRGQGGAGLIEGPEGIGRTRLLGAALDHARLIGIPVWEARLSARDGGWEALLHIGRELGRELGARVPPNLPVALRAFAEGAGQVGGDLRYQLYDGIRDTFAALLESGPVILAVDDLHHAPPPLIGLLGYLVRALVVRDATPFLLLATAQTGVAAPALAPLRDGQELGLTPARVALGPLHRADVLRLVAATLGERPDAHAVADRIAEETGGTPFYVVEYLQALAEGRSLDALAPDAPTALVPQLADDSTEVDGLVEVAEPLEVRVSVRDAVERRLGALAPDDRRVVEVLAVAGRPVDVDLLLDVLDQDEDEALDRLDALVSTGLLVEQHTGLGALLSLPQSRFGAFVYQSLPEARRAALHRRLAAALESRDAESPLSTEAIAGHYRSAGEPALAWRYTVAAAAALWERGLLADARRLADAARALDAAAAPGCAPEARSQGLLQLQRIEADTLYNSGEWSAAAPALRALREAARAAGDVRLAAVAGLDLGTTLRRLGQPGLGEALVRAVFEEARVAQDRETTADALHKLAVFAWEGGDLDACESLAAQGLVTASGPRLARCRAELLLTAAVVQASRGQLGAATAGLTEAEDLLRKLRQKRAGAVTLGNLAELLLWQGRTREALARVEDGLRMARDVLYQEGVAFLVRLRGTVLLEQGLIDLAALDLAAALGLSERTGPGGDLLAARYFNGRLALRRGDPDAALAHFEAALDDSAAGDPESYAPLLHASLARLAIRRGEASAARTRLLALHADLDTLPLPRRTQVQLHLARAWFDLGDPARAARLARTVADTATPRGFRPWALKAWKLLALCAPEDDARRARASARALEAALAADAAPSE